MSDGRIVLINTGEHSITADLLNLSREGALLNIPESDLCLLDCLGETSLFFERGGQQFKIHANPVRREGTQIAFQFRDVTAADAHEIDMKIAIMEILAARVLATV